MRKVLLVILDGWGHSDFEGAPSEGNAVELADVPTAQRTARFRCVLAFADPDHPKVLLAEGVCEGRITAEPRGTRGFGYDPLFFIEELAATFAEIENAEKNRLSHRGQALRKMAKMLRKRLKEDATAVATTR